MSKRGWATEADILSVQRQIDIVIDGYDRQLRAICDVIEMQQKNMIELTAIVKEMTPKDAKP